MINNRQSKVYKINLSVLLKRFIFLVLLPTSLLIITHKLVINQLINVQGDPSKKQGTKPKPYNIKMLVVNMLDLL